MASFSSGVPMVKIDGGKVKNLREVKGLTQLYLASVVEVTTDTISRWENKRYPQIKKENAIKLAEALEVSIEGILDLYEDQVLQPESDSEPEADQKPGPEPEATEKTPENTNFQEKSPVPSSRISVIAVSVAVVAVLCLLLWNIFSPGNMNISAVRMAPAHIVPGQPFPVVVKIDTGTEASSFILKETIPPQCMLVDGRSPGSVVDPKSGEIKWITKAKSPIVRVGYMLQTKEDFKKRDTISYSGSITQRKAQGHGNTIEGQGASSASTYHWADIDNNGMIDDEEILVVYDDFNGIEGLTLDMDEIEDIWFGSGYEWDSVKREFVIIY